MKPFSLAFHHATPHGVLSAVHLPDAPDPVPEQVLSRLHPAEAKHAVTLGGFRQVQFVGGRLALRAARQQVSAPLSPVLSDPRGTPLGPPGWTVSVSHKRTIAVAMVARTHDGTLGVDIEDPGPARLGIADRILRPEELAAIADLDDTHRWNAILLRFSIKESIYKALDPYVRRYVGFLEARVTPDVNGRADVQLELKKEEGPFLVNARHAWLHGRLLTSVRILPARPATL